MNTRKILSTLLLVVAFGVCHAKKSTNLFVKLGYPPDEVSRKLDQVFYDVFYGPNKVYFEIGDSLGYISDIKNADVRTEGMSYGMMIAVELNKKDIFDRIWRWSKKYMQHQTGPRKGYFAWSCKVDGTRNAEGSASDGELYYITSLLFASNRWGDHTGIDYKKEAQNILNCSFEKKGNSGVMPLIDRKTKLITFTPDKFGGRFTDPSYHIPAFYEVWAKYADDGRQSYYLQMASKAREYLHKSVNQITGLNPDINNYDGSLLEFRNHKMQTFRYDSWRVPMNVALDYEWSGVDSLWQKSYGEKIQNFFYSKGIDRYVDQYNVDGSLPSEEEIIAAGTFPKKLRHSIGLVATLAAASQMCKHQKRKEFVDALWNAKHEVEQDGYFDAYYDGLLRLFAFMHLSGNYMIIDKK